MLDMVQSSNDANMKDAPIKLGMAEYVSDMGQRDIRAVMKDAPIMPK